MASPSRELVEQATEVAERIATLGHDLFRGIWLTNWRGWRLVYDISSPKACQCDCAHCTLFQLNEQFRQIEVGLPFKLALYAWTEQIDKDLYGPEPYLSCKTAMQQAQCFIVYMLHHPECCSAAVLRNELELVRDLRAVYESGVAESLEQVQRHIVHTTFASLEWKRRQYFHMVLRELGWEGVLSV